jgi:hypothetical protein
MLSEQIYSFVNDLRSRTVEVPGLPDITVSYRGREKIKTRKETVDRKKLTPGAVAVYGFRELERLCSAGKDPSESRKAVETFRKLIEPFKIDERRYSVVLARIAAKQPNGV